MNRLIEASLLLSAPEVNGENCFFDNSRMEAARDLRFSSFDRGHWGASIYVRNHELTNGQCWSVGDEHFENDVTIFVSNGFLIQIRPFDRENCPLSICTRPSSLAYSVQEL